MAIDTTLVSPLRADGEPHRQCHDTDGVDLDAARRRQARTYPELTGGRGRAKLAVLAGEIGGRFSVETQTFIRLLARAKTRAIPEPCKGCDIVQSDHAPQAGVAQGIFNGELVRRRVGHQVELEEEQDKEVERRVRRDAQRTTHRCACMDDME